MNMKTAVGIAFAAAFATVAPLSAQEVKQTLSLDEAIAVTLTENPAMKAAEFEEKAAMQERRAAIGLRMPQINVTGAYAYLGKDIGFDFNEMKGPAKNLAGQLLGSGLIPPEAIPSINGLLNPLLNADWFLTLQDRSLGFVGGGVTMPIWLGGKINAANRAARINERTAAEQGNQTRNALISELVERYFGLALAMQVVEVRRQVVDGVRRHLEDAIALEKNGMIAQSERLYVEFKMAEAERELANAELQAQTIASALNSTLGQDNAWQPVTSMFIVDRVEEVAYYQDLAQDRNPLLNQVSLKRQLAEEGVRAHQRTLMLSREEYGAQLVDVFDLSAPRALRYAFHSPFAPEFFGGGVRLGPMLLSWEGKPVADARRLEASASFPEGQWEIALTYPEAGPRAMFTFFMRHA